MSEPSPSPTEKITAAEIELALVQHFGTERNFIIPNVSNGFRHISYEIDLMIVTRSRYAYEVEIKISASDLRRDALKDKWRYCRDQHYFRKSYFAMPQELLKYQDLVPEHAGIIAVAYNDRRYYWYGTEIREPVIDKDAKKLFDHEYEHLGELAMLRMWDLKHNIRNLIQQNRALRRERKDQEQVTA
jgi:hypothetical protein